MVLISLSILVVTNLFHPVNRFAIEVFLDGHMRHGCGRRSAVPMFLTWRDRDHISWSNFLTRSAPTLHPTAARRHNQGLAQRVTVPGCPRARLERDTGAARACRIVGIEQGIDTYTAGKPLGRTLAGWP